MTVFKGGDTFTGIAVTADEQCPRKWAESGIKALEQSWAKRTVKGKTHWLATEAGRLGSLAKMIGLITRVEAKEWHGALCLFVTVELLNTEKAVVPKGLLIGANSIAASQTPEGICKEDEPIFMGVVLIPEDVHMHPLAREYGLRKAE